MQRHSKGRVVHALKSPAVQEMISSCAIYITETLQEKSRAGGIDGHARNCVLHVRSVQPPQDHPKLFVPVNA